MLYFKVFSSEQDLLAILRRFKIVTSAELGPPPPRQEDAVGGEAEVQAEAGEDDGNLPQELLQEVRLKDV